MCFHLSAHFPSQVPTIPIPPLSPMAIQAQALQAPPRMANEQQFEEATKGMGHGQRSVLCLFSLLREACSLRVCRLPHLFPLPLQRLFPRPSAGSSCIPSLPQNAIKSGDNRKLEVPPPRYSFYSMFCGESGPRKTDWKALKTTHEKTAACFYQLTMRTHPTEL